MTPEVPEAAPAEVEVTQGTVAAESMRLDGAIDYLEYRLTNLRMRLNNHLRPMPEDVPGKDRPHAASLASENIAGWADRVENIANELLRLDDNLDVV